MTLPPLTVRLTTTSYAGVGDVDEVPTLSVTVGVGDGGLGEEPLELHPVRTPMQTTETNASRRLRLFACGFTGQF